jgi:hypothetical protein
MQTEENNQVFKEEDIISKSISLDLIYFQNHMFNRNMKEESESMSILQLMKSIKDTQGLIHPVTLRQNTESSYELFSGHRRYTAYKMLFESGEKEYQSIPARIYTNEVSNLDMLLMTLNENSNRKDLKKTENIQSNLSLIPYFLKLDIVNENNKNKNFELGYYILKNYISYLRSEKQKDKYFEKIQKLTKKSNVIPQLGKFFEILGTTVKQFYLSYRAYFDVSKNLSVLFLKNVIVDRHALAINNMKSEEDKNEIIARLEQGEEIKYAKLENYIRDSNAKFSPNKKKNKLIQGLEHIIIQIKTKKNLISDDEDSQIKMYIEKIENILEKDIV